MFTVGNINICFKMYFEIFSKNYILNKVLALAKSSDNPTTHANEKRNNIYLLKVNKTRHLKKSVSVLFNPPSPDSPKQPNLNLVRIPPFSFHDSPTEALKRLPAPQAPSARHTLGLHQPGVQTGSSLKPPSDSYSNQEGILSNHSVLLKCLSY